MTSTQQHPWIPLEVSGDELATYTALREDVPDYLAPSLQTWIFDRFSSSNTLSGRVFNVAKARACELALRITIPDRGPYAEASFQAVMDSVFRGPPMLIWQMVDFLASECYQGSEAIQELSKILRAAGSAWEVGKRFGRTGLCRRVPKGVSMAADATFRKPNAGKRLQEAWEKAFGVNPDPSNAYRLAVKAVEDAGILAVPTGKSEPTLGDVIREIDKGTWRLPHLREHDLAPTHDVLLGMLRTLWRGQHDRHGGPSTVGLSDVTQPEAESAVYMAVTLVGWFESGHVQQ